VSQWLQHHIPRGLGLLEHFWTPKASKMLRVQHSQRLRHRAQVSVGLASHPTPTHCLLDVMCI
jgi:hypothetical protein